MNEMKTEEQSNRLETAMSTKDKIISFLFKPGKFFSNLSKTDFRLSAVLLPLLLTILLIFVIRYMPLYSNDIENSYKNTGLKNYQNRLNTEVAEGRMVKDTADARINSYRTNIDKYTARGLFMMSMNNLWIYPPLFFLVTGVLFLIFKFIFKENTNYKMILSVYGFSYYIFVIKYLILFLVILISREWIWGINLNPLMSISRITFAGHLLEKADPFLIWFYIVLGIGLSKIFGNKNPVKYIIIMIILWVAADILFYFLFTWNMNFRFFTLY